MSDNNFTAGLGESDDCPASAAPAIDNWTENFFWVVNDQKSKLGLALHLGSTRHDFDVVRQTVALLLPDGRQVSDVSFGGLRKPGKVRGATLTFKCIEPFRKWHLTSNGVGQISTLTELWNNTPRKSHTVPLKIDISAECIGPVWIAGEGHNKEEMQQQEWASSHYQQTIRLQGIVEVDGDTYQLDGTGWRDHSRGPRDMGNWTSHALFSVPFPDGRSFGLMCVFGPGEKPVFQSAYVVRNGVIERGIARPVKPLSTDFLQAESGEIILELGDQTETLSFQTNKGVLLSMLAPYDVAPGIYREQSGSIALSETMATVTWNGVTGYGVLERSALSDRLPLV
jgi:hypothetical protein